MSVIFENLQVITGIVFCLVAGILIAFFWNFLTRALFGALVASLVEKGAQSEDSALTLQEIGIKNKTLVDFALSRKSTLSRLVSVKAPQGDEEIKYFIPAEKREKAKSIYGARQGTLLSLVIALALIALLFVLLLYVLPKFAK
ncbi:MAG: hypothetical protein IKY62_00205 [Clostridia bacterium]|nr:hypothetical protein [Clostridia bacterium]